MDEPKHERTSIQQAVVGIRSMQSLQRVKKIREKGGVIREVVEEGSVGAAGGEGRDVTEYFVIQRMQRRGKQGDWMIWGTTDAITLEDIQKRSRKR